MIAGGTSLNPGKIIELFKFDFSTANILPSTWPADHMTLYCSPYRNTDGSALVYGGQAYQYLATKLDSISIESGGKMPEPRLVLSEENKDGPNGWFFKFFNDGGDHRGITVTRTRVFAQSLDHGSAPSTDPSVKKDQVFYINQMEEKWRSQFTFKLSPALGLDSLNNKANRQLSSTQCNLKYRYWDAVKSIWVYTLVKDGGCPWGQAGEQANFSYTDPAKWGTDLYDVNDAPTTNNGADKCGLGISSCLKRFPVTTADQAFPITINLQGKTKIPKTGS